MFFKETSEEPQPKGIQKLQIGKLATASNTETVAEIMLFQKHRDELLEYLQEKYPEDFL